MRQLVPVLAALTTLLPGGARGVEPLVDAPVIWYDDDRHDIPEPAERNPTLRKEYYQTSVADPFGRALRPSNITRKIGSLFGGQWWVEAHNVNVLDEVPNSTWFTNRIGLSPMSLEEIARGPGDGTGPDLDGIWTVVSAKTEGVTPGFNVRDRNGDTFLIKFDPPGYVGMTSAAGAISVRILHAAGYNMPDDNVVRFRRDRLVLGEGVKIQTLEGRRLMTVEDLEMILSAVDRLESGEFLAIASKFLSGKPIGPFDYRGTRKDDPNDRIDHRNRRELRGFRMFAAWIKHVDTKQQNTLDMYVEEDGKHFVKHYFLDFASTLGAGARGLFPKFGFEYGWDGAAMLGRTVTLGLKEDAWRKLTRDEELTEVGYFSQEYYSPMGFKSTLPNTAFVRINDRDGYWAAKIISAFTDEHLRAACRAGKYRNPEAERVVARELADRRDVIAELWFRKVPPIDFFTVSNGSLHARDLGIERGLWEASSSRYRVRTATCDEKRRREGATDWREIDELVVGLPAGGARPFAAVDLQVNRGEGWSKTVTAYAAPASGRIVGIDR